jgi:hypothetical protein
MADFDPKAKARAGELREEMKEVSQQIARDPARMRAAEREGFAPQVRNFVRQAERERGREQGRGVEKDELHEVRRVSDPDQKRAFNRMHLGDFQAALGIFEEQGAIHWTADQNAAREALLAKYAADTLARPDQNRFVFAYTNAAVDAINRDIRGWRKERGELGPDHEFQTKHGPALFAEGDRIQFTGNARTKSARDAGFTNGVTGTVRQIDGQRMTVELDGKRHGEPRVVEFTVGDNAEAGQFNSIRAGYSGTIYKGQGKSISETYLYHSEHWRAASSYVALTRHRENISVFVARETAPDLNQLARQMARVDDRRAASQFHREEVRANERAAPQSEFRERSQQSTARQKPEDERQRKIDEVVQRMKQQRERERGDRDRDRDKSRGARPRPRRRLAGAFRAVALVSI